jgi:urea transport system permease protein
MIPAAGGLAVAVGGTLMRHLLPVLIGLAVLVLCPSARAFDAATAAALSVGDSDTRIDALNKVIAESDAAALPFLEKLIGDSVKTSGDKVFVVDGDKAFDPVTGQPTELPADADDVVNSNRMRNEIDSAISTLKLTSPDRAVRLEAAKSLQGGDTDEAKLPLVQAAEAKEKDGEIRDILGQVRANIQLSSTDKAVRLAAVKTLADSSSPNIKEMLSTRLAPDGETDPEVRTAITAAIKSIEGRLSRFELIAQIFTGVSLGSILLLAALGLAITYGLMGIINMAHGELMMIGAYSTYVVQNLFRAYLPSEFQFYLLAALPVAFLVTAGVGMVIERLVLRHLYGRSLETLLATWGISLFLMQLVRSIFGAQNVGVENPDWMSGSVSLAASLSLPYNRIVIIGFSVAVLGFMWWLLTKTRLGLFVRAVTQNRTMARCVGVPTARIDTMAFGLGSGIAGLAGVALSQIGNVGPDLGQHYIVNCFMVVVLGGVGQLAGTVLAAMGLGIVSKFLEGITGAVIAEIVVLVFVVVFIQRRPQGLFAMTGRSAEA